MKIKAWLLRRKPQNMEEMVQNMKEFIFTFFFSSILFFPIFSCHDRVSGHLVVLLPCECLFIPPW